MSAAANSKSNNFYNEWHYPKGVRPRYIALSSKFTPYEQSDWAVRRREAREQVNLDAMTFYLEPGTY